MAIKWGNTYVTAVKWGNTNCTQVKWGSTIVWPLDTGFNGSSFAYPLASGFEFGPEKTGIYSLTFNYNDLSYSGSINKNWYSSAGGVSKNTIPHIYSTIVVDITYSYVYQSRGGSAVSSCIVHTEPCHSTPVYFAYGSGSSYNKYYPNPTRTTITDKPSSPVSGTYYYPRYKYTIANYTSKTCYLCFAFDIISEDKVKSTWNASFKINSIVFQ